MNKKERIVYTYSLKKKILIFHIIKHVINREVLGISVLGLFVNNNKIVSFYSKNYICRASFVSTKHF